MSRCMIRRYLAMRRPWWLLAAGVFMLGAAAETPPSEYAPAERLLEQVDMYLDRLGQDLADKAAYADEHQSRVAKDASTVAALAMVLGKHDQANPLQGQASELIQAAEKLAEVAGDFEQAREALMELQGARQKPGSGKTLDWGPAGSLAELMKQVPVVNNSLRRNVGGRRFQQTAKASQGMAATLAAIAQVSQYDTDYCEDEAAQVKWRQYCVAMRDAATQVQAALEKADQAAATAALGKLAASCDDCHHEFRD